MRRILLLARPPAFGRAKTRLAAGIGAGPATRLARAMLADCWAAAARQVDAGTELALAVSEEPSAYPRLDPVASRHVSQGPGDLGQRMGRLALAAAREGRDVLLLGSDTPGLPASHFRAAWAALGAADVVLGPVPDGGFWCVGLSRRAAGRLGDEWLDGLDWSVDDTRGAVEQRVAALGLQVAAAPPGFDIDRAQDLPGLARRLATDAGAAPHTAAALATLDEPGARVSVILACLDEACRLPSALAALAEQPGPHEVIVSDGGSRDGGPALAAATGALVLEGPPGRGRQLAAGTTIASGRILLFLHADVRLPPRGLELVREALAGGAAEAGAFVTRTLRDPDLPNPLGPLLALADLRSRITRHPYGDQALFVTRAAHDAVGGFRPLPIMEDWDLSVRLAARRPLARIREPVLVSGRRYQRRPLRTALLMRIIPPLYRLGVDPARLARLYRSGSASRADPGPATAGSSSGSGCS